MEIIRRKVGRPRTISRDMRKKIVDLYNDSEMTLEEIGVACGVSQSSVVRIVREVRTSGSID